MSDVIDELRAVALLAANGADDRSHSLLAACGRVEWLLRALREQFLQDVVVGQPDRSPLSR